MVRGGFAVFAAHPLAILAWAGILGALIVAIAFAMRAGLTVQPEPGAADPLTFATAMGTNLLLALVQLAVYVVVLAAAMRSMLQPSRPGFAILRLGADELRLVALAIFFLILFYVGLLVATIVLAVLTGVLIGSTGSGQTMIAAVAVDVFLVLAFTAWLSVRLSLSFPLTLLRGSFTISEAWGLSKGRFWTLFGGFLLICLAVLLISVGILAVTSGDYLAELVNGGLTQQSMQAAAHRQTARQLGPIDLHMVLGWLAAGLGGGVCVALQGGAFAAATRDLVDVQAEMAETFA